METSLVEPQAETAKTEKGHEYELYRTINPVFSDSGFTEQAMESRTQMIEDAINRNLVDADMAHLLKAYLAPKNHKNYMKFKSAVEKYFPGEDINKIRNQVQKAATHILKDLWYGENNRNLERAQQADDNGKSKHYRTREDIARDKAMAKAEKSARKNLGIPMNITFLALSQEDQQRISAELHIQNS